MMNSSDIFYLEKGHVFAVPILHYNMEIAAQVCMAFETLKPDCVAVELAETMQLQLLHAAARLPDISVVVTRTQKQTPLYYLAEPCDGAFEGLRSALEANIAAYCIDLDVDDYPDTQELLPDPYAIQRIGLKSYYECYVKDALCKGYSRKQIDIARETYMAKKLKELSLRYDRILFISGMAHTQNVLDLMDLPSFPKLEHATRKTIEICTLTEGSCREVLAESGWTSTQYERLRQEYKSEQYYKVPATFPPDRQKLNYYLLKHAATKYTESSGHDFPSYNYRNIIKYCRNYSLITNRLTPTLFQLISASKGCVDHNYAYEVWLLATEYLFLRNVDGLSELHLTIEDIWGHSKIVRFHLKEPSRKAFSFFSKKKDRSQVRFKPPGMFSICSYPPEDLIIEGFGDFLKKKGTQILTDEGSRSLPFSTSIEDGIDIKETIRHWHEKKLYVKVRGKPPGAVGSVVMIFNDDSPEEGEAHPEKFGWRTTWIGEHNQESDMAFYATPITANVVGPGISRCEYGGFMMSYPPRRLYDVWSDPDYHSCRSKAEVLLLAAIDYAVKPIIVYVASKPPRSIFKKIASRYSKKVIYIPIGQLSPVTLNKIRIFHVLDGHDKRDIAGEYIL